MSDKSKKEKFKLLHVPSKKFIEVTDVQDAEKKIQSHKYPASEFMLLRRNTFRDEIIIKFVDILTSPEEPEFSTFFTNIIAAAYNHFTSKKNNSNLDKIKEYTTQIADEMESLVEIYTDTLKYEKMYIKELVINMRSFVDVINETKSTEVLQQVIEHIDKYKESEKKEFFKELKIMIQKKGEYITQNEDLIDIMKLYREKIYLDAFNCELMSKELGLNHEKTNIVEHIKTLIHRMLTITSDNQQSGNQVSDENTEPEEAEEKLKNSNESNETEQEDQGMPEFQ